VNISTKKFIDGTLGSLAAAVLFPPVRLVGKILRRKHNLENPRHIVIVKMLGGGSLFMAGAALHEIKRAFPDTKLSLLCTPAVKAFGESLNVFDHIRVIDDRGLFSLLFSSLRQLFWLFRNSDVAIDLEVHSRLTTVFVTLAMVKNRVGLVDHNSLWRRRLYTHALYVNPMERIYNSYDALLGFFNLGKLSSLEFQEQFIKENKKASLAVNLPPQFITIGVGCSDLALERQLNAEQWGQLLEKITWAFPQIQVVFLGAKADYDLAQKSGQKLTSQWLNLCGKTSLADSIKILARSTAHFGIDSALIHYARFLKVPCVGFWGPTRPENLLKPYPVAELHLYKSLSCSPCVHLTSVPPCKGQNLCMGFESDFAHAIEFLRKVLTSSEAKKTMSSRRIRSWFFYPDKEKPLPYEVEVTV
jgi:ADP-heptose:LPS heptosyltransferase